MPFYIIIKEDINLFKYLLIHYNTGGLKLQYNSGNYLFLFA